jgi:hypothetical protein
MSVIRLAHPSRPAKPVQPGLEQQVDDLFELRALLRQSQAGERALTAEVLQALTAAVLLPVLLGRVGFHLVQHLVPRIADRGRQPRS